MQSVMPDLLSWEQGSKVSGFGFWASLRGVGLGERGGGGVRVGLGFRFMRDTIGDAQSTKLGDRPDGGSWALVALGFRV